MSNFYRYNVGAFDNGLFIDEIIDHSTEEMKDQPINSLISQINSLGYTQLDTSNIDIVYFIDCVITKFANEPMRYSGEIGYRKALLAILECANRYKAKMGMYNKLMTLQTEDFEKDMRDNGSSISNYAEDPQSLNKVITDEGLLSYISNQTFDKTTKGIVEAIKDYYNGLRISKVKNYVMELKDYFGDICMYPSREMKFYDEEE